MTTATAINARAAERLTALALAPSSAAVHVRRLGRDQLLEFVEGELAVAIAVDVLETAREAHIVLLELLAAQGPVLVTIRTQHGAHRLRVERHMRARSG